MRCSVKAVLLAAGFLFAGLSQAGAPPGAWVVVSLDHIEITPSQGWFVHEGVWFVNPTPHQTQFNCTKSIYVGIADTTMANRALSVALYAKSSGGAMKVYVTGCDSEGGLIGSSVMLLN